MVNGEWRNSQEAGPEFWRIRIPANGKIIEEIPVSPKSCSPTSKLLGAGFGEIYRGRTNLNNEQFCREEAQFTDTGNVEN
jgi:hypothetical protein